jgi:hypothetical protein
MFPATSRISIGALPPRPWLAAPPAVAVAASATSPHPGLPHLSNLTTTQQQQFMLYYYQLQAQQQLLRQQQIQLQRLQQQQLALGAATRPQSRAHPPLPHAGASSPRSPMVAGPAAVPARPSYGPRGSKPLTLHQQQLIHQQYLQQQRLVQLQQQPPPPPQQLTSALASAAPPSNAMATSSARAGATQAGSDVQLASNASGHLSNDKAPKKRRLSAPLPSASTLVPGASMWSAGTSAFPSVASWGTTGSSPGVQTENASYLEAARPFTSSSVPPPKLKAKSKPKKKASKLLHAANVFGGSVMAQAAPAGAKRGRKPKAEQRVKADPATAPLYVDAPTPTSRLHTAPPGYAGPYLSLTAEDVERVVHDIRRRKFAERAAAAEVATEPLTASTSSATAAVSLPPQEALAAASTPVASTVDRSYMSDYVSVAAQPDPAAPSVDDTLESTLLPSSSSSSAAPTALKARKSGGPTGKKKQTRRVGGVMGMNAPRRAPTAAQAASAATMRSLLEHTPLELRQRAAAARAAVPELGPVNFALSALAMSLVERLECPPPPGSPSRQCAVVVHSFDDTFTFDPVEAGIVPPPTATGKRKAPRTIEALQRSQSTGSAAGALVDADAHSLSGHCDDDAAAGGDRQEEPWLQQRGGPGALPWLRPDVIPAATLLL